MSLGARIREARRAARLSQAQVGAALGISSQAVSQWENDIFVPATERLIAFASLTGVAFAWLATGVRTNATLAEGGGGAHWRGRIVPSVEYERVGEFLADQYYPDTSARSHFPCGPRSFQTLADDRSNEPEVRVGDGLVIDRDLMPTPGDIIMIRVDGEYLLRRYRPRADHVELAPHNPDWPTIRVSTIDGLLIGVVTEVSRPMRAR